MKNPLFLALLSGINVQFVTILSSYRKGTLFGEGYEDFTRKEGDKLMQLIPSDLRDNHMIAMFTFKKVNFLVWFMDHKVRICLTDRASIGKAY